MIKQLNLKLLLVGLAIAVEATLPAQSIAASPTAPTDTRLAQLFYPPASDRQIIAVTGQGRATVPADLARVNIVFTNRNSQEFDPMSGSSASSKPSAKPEPLTEASLAPIVTALKTAGVPDDKIKVTINSLERPRFPSYGRGNGSIMVELEQPTQSGVARLVKTVNAALSSPKGDRAKVFLEDIYVQYSVKSCAAVEDAAYGAAMQDAKLRSGALAKAMGVQLADVPSVAELPFIGRFYSPCSQDIDVTSAAMRRPPTAYDPTMPAAVEVYREIAVTYRLR
jgi:uncharacterized protein YggE